MSFIRNFSILGRNEVFHGLEPLTQTLRIEPLLDPNWNRMRGSSFELKLRRFFQVQECQNLHGHPENLYCQSITENGWYIIHS